MTTDRLIRTLTCLWLLGCWTIPAPGQQPTMHPTPRLFSRTIATRVAVKYLLALPPGYSKKEKWPVLIHLHGMGERGEDLEIVKRHGPMKLLARGQTLPFIVVAPLCPKEDFWEARLDALDALLDDVLARYNGDPDRVYLTGLSMGGYGTWAWATRSPERFAAIAPICGGGKPFLAYRLKDMPIWAFHGAKDAVVPLGEQERMIEALRKLGGTPNFTVYPEAGHDAWTVTYDNPDLYAWLLRQTRRRK